MNEIKLQQANELRSRIESLIETKSNFLRLLSQKDQDNEVSIRRYGLSSAETSELIDLARKAFVAGIDPKIEEAKKAFEQL